MEKKKIKSLKYRAGYSIIEDDNNYKCVLLNVFKGNSIAEFERYTLNKSLFLRLKVYFIGDLREIADIDKRVTKDVVESIDIEFDILEKFFNQYMRRKKVIELMTPIENKYFVKKMNEYIGTLVLDYQMFLKLVDFVKMLSYSKKEIDI